MKNLNLFPIGYVHVQETYPAESPRQPIYSNGSGGYIQLNDDNQLKTALFGINDFSHLWVLFQFHQNSSWKPMVQPPRANMKKKGVFATRAPYRPNPIGISTIKLDRIVDNKIYFLNHDFINLTPVFDIKPYIPLYDSFPDANMGWMETQEPYIISWHPEAKKQLLWLKKNNLNLEPFIHTQLSYDPTENRLKRVSLIKGSYYQLSFRTWRIYFTIQKLQNIQIEKIDSGYTSEDLAISLDPYLDKDLHRQFLDWYAV